MLSQRGKRNSLARCLSPKSRTPKPQGPRRRRVRDQISAPDSALRARRSLCRSTSNRFQTHQAHIADERVDAIVQAMGLDFLRQRPRSHRRGRTSAQQVSSTHAAVVVELEWTSLHRVKIQDRAETLDSNSLKAALSRIVSALTNGKDFVNHHFDGRALGQRKVLGQLCDDVG